MSIRERAVAALLARVASAYGWATPPARRLKLWSDVPPAMRPCCFLFEGGAETYEDAASGAPKRTLEPRLFIYVDARDPDLLGAATLNAIMDALDAALAPAGADVALGRTTLGGAAYRASIDGRPLKDPGDLDGDGLLVVPLKIVLPLKETSMSDPKQTAEALDALVEHWFFETFHGSLVARSTETWNTVHAAKEELKRRLAAYVAADTAGALD